MAKPDGMLRVGIVGGGLMGRRHGHAYRSMPGVEIAGFVDRDPGTRANLGETFGVPCYGHWEELFAAGLLDAVSICLPDNLHLAASLAALERGLAVLLEKPITTDVAQAERIAEAAQGRLLLVGHMLRFDPRYQQARRLLAAGRVGDLVHVMTRRDSAIGSAARYGSSTSLVYHLCVHDIDLVQWVTGRRIVEVTAKAASRRLAEYGHLDSVLVLATLADATPLSMEASWILPSYFGSGLDARLELVGTQGRMEVHGLDQGLRVADAEAIQFPDTARWVEYDDGSAGGILTAEIGHFVRCIVEGIAPAIPVEDAVSAVKVAAAIERSIAEQRTVRV